MNGVAGPGLGCNSPYLLAEVIVLVCVFSTWLAVLFWLGGLVIDACFGFTDALRLLALSFGRC
jgi:hypothetical protein